MKLNHNKKSVKISLNSFALYAVLGIADVRVLQQIIFQVNHGSFPTDKQNALAVIQQPHLVRGHKIFATMSSDEFKKWQPQSKNFSLWLPF